MPLSPKLQLWRLFSKYSSTHSSHQCLEGRKILPEKGYHACLFKKTINKCIAYYDYLNLIDIHRHFSSKVKHTNGRYSLCRPLWCRSLWTGAIYDVGNCSVSATGERDRSRIQVQFRIKCFNISKN